MNKLKSYYDKYSEILLYLIFGVLTTVVSIASYFLFSQLLHVNYLISNVLSWIFAVAFAYLSNRKWVFKSTAHRNIEIFKEISSFVSCRLLSGVIDMLTLWILVELVGIGDMYAKLATQVIVTVLNYAFSKLFVFRKSNSNKVNN
ncbi:MAG: GtrA family protein [Clostridioides sp.]|jgi:putative flippase GtrA|nr:GtrA family protein [Clostridioides sp.]